MCELRAHRAAHDLRVPEIDRAGKRDRRGGSQCSSGAKNRPHVSRILHTVEDHDAEHRALENRIKILKRHPRDGEHSLWGISLGGAREIGVRYVEHFDTSFAELGEQSFTSRSLLKSW